MIDVQLDQLRAHTFDYRAGAKAVQVCVEYCLKHGIEALTLFAFSSENWGRPEEEVGALMKLFMGALEREVDELDRRGVPVRVSFAEPAEPAAIVLTMRESVATIR